MLYGRRGDFPIGSGVQGVPGKRLCLLGLPRAHIVPYAQEMHGMKDLYYIACRIERGAFTNERTFQIRLSPNVRYRGENEGQLVGTAHVDHLYNAQRRRLSVDEPAYGETIDGYVLCRKIRELPNGRLLVEVPSADVIHVLEDELVPRD